MSNELLDLYSETNEPLGVNKLRSEIHRDGDWHRTVHIYVMNDKGEHLVHLRSPQKDGSPNCWDLRFGGHLASGQTYEEAAVRELEEEIGLQAKISDFIPGTIYSHDDVWNREHSQVYYYIYNGDVSNLSFNDNEVVKAEWMSYDDIMASMEVKERRWVSRPPAFQKIVEEYKSLKNRKLI